jgi:hypothetical protein
MGEKYQITFQKALLPNGDSVNIATTSLDSNSEIVIHLGVSSAIETRAQIEDINNAVSIYQSGAHFDEFWGEIATSSLWIYPDRNVVTVGHDSTAVPIPDFLQLLQEWLVFIQD